MANFSRLFCFLYIIETLCLAIKAESRTCALSYVNDLKDKSTTICSEFVILHVCNS